MRKFLGVTCAVLGLGCAAFFVMAVGDLLTGGSPETGASVLAGLAVFFGGLTAVTGFGAVRLLTTAGAQGRTPTEAHGPVVDIALEARVLALAAESAGRLTVAEVAIGCAVSLADAERALDALTQRGHADLEVTAAGDAVYVVRGLLSAEEKRSTVDVSEHVRS